MVCARVQAQASRRKNEPIISLGERLLGLKEDGELLDVDGGVIPVNGALGVVLEVKEEGAQVGAQRQEVEPDLLQGDLICARPLLDDDLLNLCQRG